MNMISKGIPADIDLTIDNEFGKGVYNEFIRYENNLKNYLPWNENGLLQKPYTNNVILRYISQENSRDYYERLFSWDDNISVVQTMNVRIQECNKDDILTLIILSKKIEIDNGNIILYIDFNDYYKYFKMNDFYYINDPYSIQSNNCISNNILEIDITPIEFVNCKLTDNEINNSSIITGDGEDLYMKIKKKLFINKVFDLFENTHTRKIDNYKSLNFIDNSYNNETKDCNFFDMKVYDPNSIYLRGKVSDEDIWIYLRKEMEE